MNFSQSLDRLGKNLEDELRKEEGDFLLFPKKFQEQVKEGKLSNSKVSLEWVQQKLVDKIFDQIQFQKEKQRQQSKFEQEELQKDLQAEKEKKKNMEGFLQQQKDENEQMKRKLEEAHLQIESKDTQYRELKGNFQGQTSLINQIEIYQEKIEQLQLENAQLKKGNKYKGSIDLSESTTKESRILNDAFMARLDDLDLTMENGMRIREWFENFKDSMLNNIERQREQIE